MKKINQLLNCVIGAFVGSFIGRSVYRIVDYVKRPGIYELMSAPWYTDILIYAMETIVIIAILLAIKQGIQKKSIKEYVILIMQLLLFYIFPLFAGPTDGMGMVVLLILSTTILSMLLGIISESKWKYVYPAVIAVLFIPSVFVYYNKSAMVHSVWYLVVSFVGLSVGSMIKRVVKAVKS